jgi:hypothetical protein
MSKEQGTTYQEYFKAFMELLDAEEARQFRKGGPGTHAWLAKQYLNDVSYYTSATMWMTRNEI